MDFDDLTPELREKAKACKTPEEMLALAKEEGFELSETELNALSGGGPQWNCDYTCGEREDDTTCWTL